MNLSFHFVFFFFSSSPSLLSCQYCDVTSSSSCLHHHSFFASHASNIMCSFLVFVPLFLLLRFLACLLLLLSRHHRHCHCHCRYRYRHRYLYFLRYYVCLVFFLRLCISALVVLVFTSFSRLSFNHSAPFCLYN